MNWDVFERIFSDHYFFTCYNVKGFVSDYPKVGAGSFITTFIGIRDGDMLKYVFEASEYDRAAYYTASKLINDDHWRHWLYEKIDYYTKNFFEVGERLRQLLFARLLDR